MRSRPRLRRSACDSAPIPQHNSRATPGGSIGNNACGSRAPRYGRTSDNVLELDLITATGEHLTAGTYGRNNLSSAGSFGPPLDALVSSHLGIIRTEFGRFTRQVSGYSIEHLLPERGADLAKFLAGSEGTLAVSVGARVRLVESPSHVTLAVLGYPSMAAAADVVMQLLSHNPIALEGMDARMVEALRRRRGSAATPILPR